MAPSSKPSKEHLEALRASASALSTILGQFVEVLTGDAPIQGHNAISNPPEPLDVLQTAATLLKAHTTKLSLLMINKPFTPTAIKSVISDVSGTCVPAMMSAVEICKPGLYGLTLHNEVKTRVRQCFRQLNAMMLEVLKKLDDSEADEAASRDQQLASTGMLWEFCDRLIVLKSLGLSGILVEKANTWREQLLDAIQELKEWQEEAEDEGFDEDDDDFSEEEPFAAHNKYPKDNEDLKKAFDTSMQKLRLVGSLFQALTTKRLKTIKSPDGTNLTQADSMMKTLGHIQSETDSLAMSFYDLDIDSAKSTISGIVKDAKDAVRLGRTNWNAKNDEFTEWCDKWGRILDRL